MNANSNKLRRIGEQKKKVTNIFLSGQHIIMLLSAAVLASFISFFMLHSVMNEGVASRDAYNDRIAPFYGSQLNASRNESERHSIKGRKEEPAKERYLITWNGFGRHSNQLTCITTLLALAQRLNRTAVIPDVRFYPHESRKKRLSVTSHFSGEYYHYPLSSIYHVDYFDYYSQSNISSSDVSTETSASPMSLKQRFTSYLTNSQCPWRREMFGTKQESSMIKKKFPCIIEEAEFADHLLSYQQMNVDENQMISDQINDNELMVSCLTMKGMKAANSPPSFFSHNRNKTVKLKCGQSAFVKNKKRLDVVLNAVLQTQLSETPSMDILYIPLLIYLSPPIGSTPVAMPSDHTSIDAPLVEEVQRAWSLLHRPYFSRLQKSPSCSRSIGVGRTVKAVERTLINTTVGIHIRALEGSCRGRAMSYVDELLAVSGVHNESTPNRATHRKQVVEQILPQCHFTPEYLNQYIPLNHRTVFIADDGQQPSLTKAIKAYFQHSVEERTSYAGQEDQDQYEHLSSTSVMQLNHWYKFYNDNTSDKVLRSIIHSHVAFMNDFWELVCRDVFIGNQMSTVSVNVCRRRQAGMSSKAEMEPDTEETKKECDNFISVSSL